MRLLPTNLTSKPDGNKNDNEVFLSCDDSHRAGGMHSDAATDAESPTE